MSLNAVGHINTEIATHRARPRTRAPSMPVVRSTERRQSRLGANALLGVSMAVMHAADAVSHPFVEIHRVILVARWRGSRPGTPAVPMINILHCGAHATRTWTQYFW